MRKLSPESDRKITRIASKMVRKTRFITSLFFKLIKILWGYEPRFLDQFSERLWGNFHAGFWAKFYRFLMENFPTIVTKTITEFLNLNLNWKSFQETQQKSQMKNRNYHESSSTCQSKSPLSKPKNYHVKLRDDLSTNQSTN
jgi:hypothetical protein